MLMQVFYNLENLRNTMMVEDGQEKIGKIRIESLENPWMRLGAAGIRMEILKIISIDNNLEVFQKLSKVSSFIVSI